MNEFAPHSWETPSRWKIRESVVRRAPFAGRETDWQVNLVKVPASKWPILWLRPLTDEREAGFTVLDGSGDQPMFFAQRVKLASLTEEIDVALDEKLAPHPFYEQFLARQFFLNSRGELRSERERAHESLVVGANGIAAWNLAFVRKEVYEPAAFKWSKPLASDEFQRLPALDLWARVQQLLAEPRGEVAFARGFAFLDEDERRARIQRTRRASIEQLQELLGDLLTCSLLWDKMPGVQSIYFTINSRQELGAWDNAGLDVIEMPDSLSENIQKLWRHFRPFERRIARFLCVKNVYANQLDFEVARPTAHEQLEAHLRWREWEATTEKTR